MIGSRSARVFGAVAALLVAMTLTRTVQPQDRLFGPDGPTRPQVMTREMVPQTGAVDPDSYRLGPGDLLALYIWGPISITHPLEVGPDGATFIPGMGPLQLSGLTLTDARTRIDRRVKEQYRGVRVEVRLHRLRTFSVYLTGEVKQVGPVLANGSNRVSDVLQDSLILEKGSRRNIVLRHRDGGQSIVDLGLFNRTGRIVGDQWLRDGDVVHVPRAVSYVGLWGGVARPDEYELGSDDSLSTLLMMGGGMIPAAVVDRALFTRYREQGERDSTWISLADIVTRRFDPRLLDGDNLYVFFTPGYHETHQVAVVGRVLRAGDYPIRLGTTRLTNAIEAAGGFRDEADLSAIRLIRTRVQRVGDDVEFQRLSRLSREQMTESEYEAFRTQLAAAGRDLRVDWARATSGDPALDPLLMDGDVVRVDRVANTVRVDGQVRRPGVFAFTKGESWSHYVKLAGGWTDQAARAKVRVTRSVNGQTVLAGNAEGISPGDFIWVPERPDTTTWERLKDLLTIAGAVATIVLAFRR